jgi:hypothetical protein
MPWIAACHLADAWKLGVLWLALTLGFEFPVGQYIVRNSWGTLTDYNVPQGRIWVFVLIMTLIALRLALAAARI